jgi:group I intron endonuclease
MIPSPTQIMLPQRLAKKRVPNPQWQSFLPWYMRGQRVSGIYAITSPSGKLYLGSAVNIRARWKTHRKQLRGGIHHSAALQRAADKYGVDNFSFKILLICEPKNLLLYEQLALNTLKPRYNIALTAGSNFGRKFGPQTAEHIAKRVAKSLGKRRSPETCANISAGKKGKPPSEKQLMQYKNLSVKNMGKTLSEKTKAKIAVSVRAWHNRGVDA